MRDLPDDEGVGVEITIGVQHVARELVLETDLTADEVATAVSDALRKEDPLVLNDSRGRRVLVPHTAIAYVELGGDEARKVGFHNL